MRHVIYLLLCFFVFATPVSAIYDPLVTPNNRYGIHIVDPNDIPDAARLVNGTNGEWGYVTLVIPDNDRDHGKWQRIFNQMRALHLIPIVRLATHVDGDAWTKPYTDAGKDWARFLNSLNWPTENRYVILYNEPNHANEWGGDINPEDYAHTFVSHAQLLKKESEDFFILPAGLDVSAASDGRSLDAATYLGRMIRAEPEMFTYADGWSSHSYPNPGFSGSVFATGRGSLRSYAWERAYLRELGVTKKLPVFITETGWVHSDGVQPNYGLLSASQVAANFQLAASLVWNDPEIVAVTPFVMNYQGLPFDHFSWKKLNSSDYFPQYDTYRAIPKLPGKPYQRERYTAEHRIIPASLVAGSTYERTALLKNEGQGILSEQNGEYAVELVTPPKFSVIHDPLPVMEPGQYGTLTLHLETPNTPGTYPYELVIRHFGRSTTVESGTFSIIPPPSVTITAQFGWKSKSNTSDATVLVYDHHTLIHKSQGVAITDGTADIRELRNVLPGNTYRIVVLVPYYLPRQTIAVLRETETMVVIPRLYPLDFDLDGALTIRDLASLVTLTPNFIASLVIGP